jgi:hypothetical protein
MTNAQIIARLEKLKVDIEAMSKDMRNNPGNETKVNDYLFAADQAVEESKKLKSMLVIEPGTVSISNGVKSRKNTVLARVVKACNEYPINVETLIQTLVDKAPANSKGKKMTKSYATTYVKSFLKDNKIYVTK